MKILLYIIPGAFVGYLLIQTVHILTHAADAIGKVLP